MATTYKTCVSAGAKTPNAMRSVITRALKLSDYAEARLDFLDSKDDMFCLLDMLPHDILKKRIVCTVRAAYDGGQFAGSESDRLDILRKVAAYKPYRLDVELDALQKDKKLADDTSGTSILASWHSFDNMPRVQTMRKKILKMMSYTTHLKIACMAKNTAESVRMLEMYKWFGEENRKDGATTHDNRKNTTGSKTGKNTLISFAMGDAGMLTRILCMHLGSPYTYVSLGKALAPGQISLEDVKALDRTMSKPRRTS